MSLLFLDLLLALPKRSLAYDGEASVTGGAAGESE